MEEIKINCRWTSQSLEVLKIVPENTLRILRVIYDVFCSVPVLAEKQSTLLQIIYTMFCMFPLHVLHVPLTCSTCSSCMFYMFLLHVQHVQGSCSTCTFYVFSMFKVHVLHVLFTCSACSKDMFCMYLLLVQYVILHLHSELQWAITHSNLHRFTRFLFIWVRFIET